MLLPLNLLAEGIANIGSLVEYIGGKPTPRLEQSLEQLEHWVVH